MIPSLTTGVPERRVHRAGELKGVPPPTVSAPRPRVHVFPPHQPDFADQLATGALSAHLDPAVSGGIIGGVERGTCRPLQESELIWCETPLWLFVTRRLRRKVGLCHLTKPLRLVTWLRRQVQRLRRFFDNQSSYLLPNAQEHDHGAARRWGR